MNIVAQVKKILVNVGRAQTTIFMGLIYYLVIGPMAVVYQLLKREKQPPESYWVEKEKIENWEKYLKRQF